MRRLRSADYVRTRWKNDGGWTTEIARDPASSDDPGLEEFRWRVSIAEIERDGAFSAFPGVDRDLLLLSGNGIELDIGDAEPVRLDQRFQRVRFAGEDAVHCRLLAGPTRDFNVMVRRGVIEAETLARPLTGSMLIFAEPHTRWLIHVCAGHAAVRDEAEQVAADAGDTLISDMRETGRVVIEGAGEIVLVRLREVDAMPNTHVVTE